MSRRTSLLILVIALPAVLFAQQVHTKWTRTLPAIASAIRELPGGGFVVAGDIRKDGYHSVFTYVARLSAAGDTLWTRTFGRLAEEDSTIGTDGGPETVTKDGKPIRIIVADSRNHVRDVFALPDTSILLLTTHNPDTTTDNCRCLIHVSPRGDSLGSVYLCKEEKFVIFGMNQTPGGELIAFGNDDPWTMNCEKFFVLRLTAKGDTLARYHFERTCHSCPKEIRRMPDGGYAIAGTSGASSLARLDSAGQLLWNACTKSHRDASITNLLTTRDGGIITLGATGSLARPPMKFAQDVPKDGGNSDAVLVKYGAKGDTLWQHAYSGAEPTHPVDAVELRNGDLLIAGAAGEWRHDHPYLLCTKANGDSLWSMPVATGQVRSLINTHDGGCLLLTYVRAAKADEGTTTLTRFTVPKEKKRP